MSKQIINLISLACIELLFSCASNQQKSNINEKDALVENIDSTVNPAEDFFMFANGKWFKDNPIPSSESSNGIFRTIADTVNASIRQICENTAATSNEKGSNKQKIGDFYFSGMDTVTVEKEGIAAFKEELELIDEVKNIPALMQAAARIHIISGAPLFGFYIGQDDKLSSKNAIFIYQGGLGLPNRDYYFDSDSRTTKLREKYNQHLNNMFQLMGSDDATAKKSASSVFELETSLAKASRKLEALRDPFKNYNKMSFEQLQKSYPEIDWRTFMSSVNIQKPDTVIVGQPEFLTELNKEIKFASLDVWKDYLRFHLVKGLAAYLDNKTYLEYFSFYSNALRGIEEPKPRWKRVVEQTDNSLGELIGQIYIDEYLPEGSKEKLVEIGTAIKDVYAERIKKLDWMSDATKEKALKKLSTMMFKVGYPDKWKDMTTLQVDRIPYVQNVIRANEWHWNYMVNKYGKPVDRTEWQMQPQTYNAYYNPSNNEIVVPACNIIVPGYERVLADDAILYSIIGGSTFGHEITHGFDDQGSKYDEQGNLNNWWTMEDSIRFYSKTKLIVQQFDDYVAVDSLHINGDATQGENIADLGGIMMGYEAFKKTKQSKENKTISGLSPDQRFFLGYAMAWMLNVRPEALADQVKTDVHSPAKYRIIGPLSNMPEFYTTFGIKEGDFLWRADSLRIRIW